MCYVYGCVMCMDVLAGGGREARRRGGRDAFKTRTHTSESGGRTQAKRARVVVVGALSTQSQADQVQVVSAEPTRRPKTRSTVESRSWGLQVDAVTLF